MHSIDWSPRAASRSLAGQFAVMHSRAACWKSQLVHTHGISALYDERNERRKIAIATGITHNDEHLPMTAALVEQ